MDLGLDVVENSGWIVLSVQGEVDVATAPRLRERLIGLVAEGRRRIIVDLDGVEFLDSTGLGVLVGALKRVRTHDGELALVCNKARILKGFEITGLTRVFPIYPAVDDAVAAGASSTPA
jgi:anti-sigma B factor antagonist